MNGDAGNPPRVALVTGATSGIGRAIALRLSADGFHVIAAGRDAARGAATVALCRSADFTAFDTTVEADWQRVTAAIVAKHARLDAVVNSAGAFFSKPLPDTSLAEFRALWEADVESVVMGTKWALRAMRDTATAGSIVNISSLAGVIGLEDCAAYCAAKAAVTHFSRIAAVEAGDLAPPCRVNSLNPGVIMSEMITNAYGDTPEVRNFVTDGNALKRPGEVDDIAAAASFLAGPRSRFVTGTVLVVDGGRGAD
jgi:NAD(P)-dependent dehydrogenase (short-subunit alcohol dehydrogenase family)